MMAQTRLCLSILVDADMSEHTRNSACKAVPAASYQDGSAQEPTPSSVIKGAQNLMRLQEDPASKTARRSGPKSSSSNYIGVSAVKSSKYKKPGRWEAHIWDRGVPEGSKGRQLHLGSFPSAILAARAYDRAAYVMRGPDSELNFPADDYKDDTAIPQLMGLSKQEIVTAIRRMQKEEEEAEERGQQPQVNQEEAAAACLSELLTKKKQDAKHRHLPPLSRAGDRKVKEEHVPVPCGIPARQQTGLPRPHVKKQLVRSVSGNAQPMATEGGLHNRENVGQGEVIARRSVKRKAPDTKEVPGNRLPPNGVPQRWLVSTSMVQPKPKANPLKHLTSGKNPAAGVPTTTNPRELLSFKTVVDKAADTCKGADIGAGRMSSTSEAALQVPNRDTAIHAPVKYSKVQDARARLEAQILAAGNTAAEKFAEPTCNSVAPVPAHMPTVQPYTGDPLNAKAEANSLQTKVAQPVSGATTISSTPPVIVTPSPVLGQPVAVSCTQDETSTGLQSPLLHSPNRYTAQQCIEPVSPFQCFESPKDESSSGAADLLAFKHGIQDLVGPASSIPHGGNDNPTPASPTPYRRAAHSCSSQLGGSPNIGLQMPSPALLLSPVSWSKAFKTASSPPADPAGILPVSLVLPRRPQPIKLESPHNTGLPASNAIPDQGVPLVLSHRQQAGILPYWHATVYAVPSASLPSRKQ